MRWIKKRLLHEEGGSKGDEIENKIKCLTQVTHTLGMSKEEKEITQAISNKTQAKKKH
jgi:hypothetical protein